MRDFLNELLAKFSLSNKVNVGVSISQNVGLEMIVVDPGSHQVLKYANRPLEYNPQTREIEENILCVKTLRLSSKPLHAISA